MISLRTTRVSKHWLVGAIEVDRVNGIFSAEQTSGVILKPGSAAGKKSI